MTPSKYNGGQLDMVPGTTLTTEDLVYNFHLAEKVNDTTPLRYVLGIDWLEMSLRGDLFYLKNADTYTKGDFTLTRLDLRTRHFADSFNVYYAGRCLGVILFSPRSTVIPIECIQFKIDNQYFYKDVLPLSLNRAITLFLDAFELTFNNFTRLDIYIDFVKFNQSLSFTKFVELYAKGEIETKGKITKWCPYYSKIAGKMELTGFSMGSRSSEKFLRCYNKSAEIEESHKDYIKEYWKLNGMDTDKPIYRFELQLNSKFFSTLKTFRDFDVTGSSQPTEFINPAQSQEVKTKLLMLKPGTILGLFDVAMNNYFDFFIEEKRSRNDDKVPFEIFDWAVLREMAVCSYRFVKQRLRSRSFTWRQKMIVARNLFREYVYARQDNRWIKPLAKIITEYNLLERWNKRYEFYVKEFMQLVPLFYQYDTLQFASSFSYAVGELKLEENQTVQLPLIELPKIDGSKLVPKWLTNARATYWHNNKGNRRKYRKQ